MAISSYSFPISKVKVVYPSGGCLRCSSSPSQSCRDQGSLMALFRGKVGWFKGKTIVEEIDPTSLAVGFQLFTRIAQLEVGVGVVAWLWKKTWLLLPEYNNNTNCSSGIAFRSAALTAYGNEEAGSIGAYEAAGDARYEAGSAGAASPGSGGETAYGAASAWPGTLDPGTGRSGNWGSWECWELLCPFKCWWKFFWYCLSSYYCYLCYWEWKP